ncbi:MAG: 16S rRNA (guanine(527)-N(7))-methyltransferase RsmG [Thermoleophilaceae bacterium]
MKRGSWIAERSGVERSLAASGRRFGLGGLELERLRALIAALAAEPHAPTAVRDPVEIADRHVAAALAALELESVRAARRIVDVGSGAGFPGLPLAIALPAAWIDLLEASRRKCRVIERLIAAATVSNARAVATRAETWADGEGRDAYDLVTVRAVAGLAVLVEYAAPLLRPGGVLVAWKGRREAAEERAGAAAAATVGLGPVEVIGVKPFPTAHDHHLHVFAKVSTTPPGFPRRPGRAAKRPLGH